ncbi:MAG: hypothetical protein IPP69_05165 [Flavobacteriales bacterium]|nr:hypothetical protein [Flavobacteriales bacterium]
MKLALLICLLWGALNGLSQNTLTISGKVTDMSNTEGIPDCLVQVNGTNIRVKPMKQENTLCHANHAQIPPQSPSQG